MLIITRKPGERIYIGDDIELIVTKVNGHTVSIGIEAPKSVRIKRSGYKGEESQPVSNANRKFW